MTALERILAARTADEIIASLAAANPARDCEISPEDLHDWLEKCPIDERFEAALRLGYSFESLIPPDRMTERKMVALREAIEKFGAHQDASELFDAFDTLILHCNAIILILIGGVSPLPPLFQMIAIFENIHLVWREARKHSPDLRHPLAPLVDAYQQWAEANDRKIEKVRILTFEQNEREYTKRPGLLSLAEVEAVEVEGEAYTTRFPGYIGPKRVYRRVRKPVPGELFAGPRTLASNATGGLIMAVVANHDLTGDERALLRADVLALGTFAYALVGRTLTLDDDALAELVGGLVTRANLERGLRALRFMRWAELDWTGRPVSMFDSEVAPKTGLHRLGAPRWWADFRQRKTPNAWQLSGSIWRRKQRGRITAGGEVDRYSALDRTIDGLEQGLAWYDRMPVSPGGPGPEIFVPWWQVLRLAGEPVDEASPLDGTPGRRWRRRVASLKEAGYVIATIAAEAPIGDTVEIVEVVTAFRNRYRSREAGLIVRLSARYLAACAATDEMLAKRVGVRDWKKAEWSRYQASSMLPGSGLKRTA